MEHLLGKGYQLISKSPIKLTTDKTQKDDLSMQSSILNWLFSSLDELIDCEFETEDKRDDSLNSRDAAGSGCKHETSHCL